jgi:hypothetical protein
VRLGATTIVRLEGALAHGRAPTTRGSATILGLRRGWPRMARPAVRTDVGWSATKVVIAESRRVFGRITVPRYGLRQAAVKPAGPASSSGHSATALPRAKPLKVARPPRVPAATRRSLLSGFPARC